MIQVLLTLYTILLCILFFYAFHSFFLIFHYYRLNRRKQRSRKTTLRHTPVVTVQLPIYNEKYVVRRLIQSVAALDYPKAHLEIQVLDDSNDETVSIVRDIVQEYRDQEYDIKHIRRSSRTDFKAGALENGLHMARGEFIAIFDADFIAPPYFLRELLPEFDDPRVGGVQARWGHLNHDYSFLTRSQAIGLDNHFVMEQGLRSRLNFFINFNGTCGLWRKKAIKDAGGWSGETLAEDLDLSYRVQLKDWKIQYRGDVIVKGELPDRAYSYRVQQNRWAKGTIQVARKLLSRILRSPLSTMQKYEAFIHLTCHVNFLAMLGLALFALPVVYCKVEGLVSNSFFIAISFFTIGALGYPFLYYLSQKESYPDYRRRLPSILGVIAYSMGLSVSNTKAIIEGFFKKDHVFTRTPKSGGKKRAYRYEMRSFIPLIEILFGLYMLVTVVYVISHLQLILVPFLLLYCYGFLSMGLSSVKDEIFPVRPQEVLCSRKNS